MMRNLVLAAIIATMANCSLADAGNYDGWRYSEVKKRYYTTYTYQSKTGGKASQNVLYYPRDKQRKNWYYYVNSKGQSWGRVAHKKHPSYKPGKMLWQKWDAKKKAWVNYPTKGYCPAPANGKNPIDMIPDPPV